MSAAHAAGKRDCARIDIQKPASRRYLTAGIYDKNAVKLSKLLHALPVILASDIAVLGALTLIRIDDCLMRVREYLLRIADDKRRSDLAPLAPLDGKVESQTQNR